MRILCVDDDLDTRVLLEHLLRLSDLEILCVEDTAAALLLIEKERFSLYIIDGELPGVSGLRLCEEIRRRDPKTPIIIYSGHAYASDREAGRLAGANAYLVKPYVTEIVPTVERLLEEAAPPTLDPLASTTAGSCGSPPNRVARIYREAKPFAAAQALADCVDRHSRRFRHSVIPTSNYFFIALRPTRPGRGLDEVRGRPRLRGRPFALRLLRR